MRPTSPTSLASPSSTSQISLRKQRPDWPSNTEHLPTVSETVLGDSSVDAVVIASSTDTHADLIMRSAAAGKAIFCEKPVDLSLERARVCAEAVAKAGVTCMIGFNRRFDPTFAALKARLDAGEIGEPEMMVITSRDPGAPPVSYIKVSGGIFKDMLIHDFDMFRFVLGDDAETVYATGSCLADPAIADAGDIDSSVVTIRTRRGRLCQINTSRRAVYGYDQRFEVLGSNGMLQAGNVRPTEVLAYTAKSVAADVPEAFFLERYRAAYAIEMAQFFAALIERQTRADVHRRRCQGAWSSRMPRPVPGRSRKSLRSRQLGDGFAGQPASSTGSRRRARNQLAEAAAPGLWRRIR